MDVPCRDMGAVIVAKNVCEITSLTAAGTGDATEIDGLDLDVTGHSSGKLIITADATLTTDKVLTVATKIRSGATAALCNAAVGAVLEAATNICTVSGTTAKREIDVDLSAYGPFVAFDITPNLTATGTDTAILSATFISLPASY